MPTSSVRVLGETRYLRLCERDGWSYVERPNLSGVVTIVAVTSAGDLLFVEQHRPPVDAHTIELPAGLAGDEAQDGVEDLTAAAARELEEETGYRAGRIEPLIDVATSPGMTNEMASLFLATDLVRTGPGGGVGGERIVIHEVPLDGAADWMRAQAAAGRIVAAKAWAGLFFALEAARAGRVPRR